MLWLMIATSVGYTAVAADVYVDVAHQGCEDGTAACPFDTVSEAHLSAVAGDRLLIQAGNYAEVLRLTKAVRLESQGGVARIGTFQWPLVYDAATDFNHPTGNNGEGDHSQHSAGYLIEGLNLTLPPYDGDFRLDYSIRRGEHGECIKNPFTNECIYIDKERRLYILQVWDTTLNRLADQGPTELTPAAVPVKWEFFGDDPDVYNVYYPCSIDFTTRGVPGHTYDIRLYWDGWWNGQVSQVQLKPARGILALPPQPDAAALLRKAQVWDDNIQANHLVNGQIVSRTLAGAPEEIGDAAIWTGLYVATEALRYATTNQPAARTNMENGLAALHRMQTATGQPGLLCRYVYPDGTPHEKAPSKDTYTGVMFGYGVAYPFISDPVLRAIVEQDVRNIAAYSVDHGFDTVDGDQILILHLLRVAVSVLAGSPEFTQLYRDRVNEILPPGTLDPSMDERILTQTLGDREADAASSQGTHHLKWLALYNLARLETADPQVGQAIQAYRRMVEDMWIFVRDEYNTLDNFTHALYGLSCSEADVRDGIWSLQLFPFDEADPYLGRRGLGVNYGDEIYRDMVNNELGGIFESDFGFGRVTRYPIPLDKRHRDAFIWQRGARRLEGDSADYLYPGLDYLLVYWMGRYHGLFDPYANVIGSY